MDISALLSESLVSTIRFLCTVEKKQAIFRLFITFKMKGESLRTDKTERKESFSFHVTNNILDRLSAVIVVKTQN